MINFVDVDLDQHEKKFVKRTLELSRDIVQNTDSVEACLDVGFDLTLFKEFSKEDFTAILDKLMAMHTDELNVYYVTDFHFLIIYKLLKSMVNRHNELVLQGLSGILMDSSFTINFDELAERLFHDTDFLLTSEEYGELTSEEREALDMSPELFSICNNLPPHPSELQVVSKPYKKKKRSYSL